MDALERGRGSFAKHAWLDAYSQLELAAHEATLQPEDLERLAQAAYLVGREADSADVLARAYHAHLDATEPQAAARCAFWLAFQLLNAGEMARGGGWLARAHQLLQDGPDDCVEQGYLFVPQALAILETDAAGAFELFSRADAIGQRFRDQDLIALARLGRGQALYRLGRTPEAIALLDEVMVATTAGEVSPLIAGLAYCAAIISCQDVYDLRRAQEWTTALTHWCEEQPDLVPYRGQCLVHRSQIMMLHGAWADAMHEAQRARERLSHPPGNPAAGLALYQEGELHRLRGELSAAEQAYRQANQCGHQPQPGLALLRLAQGRVDAAQAAIRRTCEEASSRLARSRLLPAMVEIMLAAGDVPAARTAATELVDVASDIDAPFLHALAAHAFGAVLLAEGDARAALDELRRAWSAWREIDAPYEAARVRVLIGRACRELGDEDSAQMELDAARWVFSQLGAGPCLAEAEALAHVGGPASAGGLTAREVQVLRLVAAGKTNRAIASDLFLSEKTVARHLSNIFTKLDLSSRSAATAYAYEHGLV